MADDLGKDSAEQHDVADEHPEIVARIKGIMKDAHQAPPPQIEPDAPDGRQHR